MPYSEFEQGWKPRRLSATTAAAAVASIREPLAGRVRRLLLLSLQAGDSQLRSDLLLAALSLDEVSRLLAAVERNQAAKAAAAVVAS